MAPTKFSAGERVTVSRGGGFAAPAGFYRVVTALPVEKGQQQYRVRSETETFDRIIDESRLEAVHHE